MSTDDVPHPLIHRRSTLQNSDLFTSSFLSSPRTSTRVLIGSGLRSSVVISSFSLSASLSIQILLQRFAKSTSDHYRKIPSSFHPPLLNEGTQPETVNLHQTIFRIRFRFTELPTRAVRDILWNLESRRQRYPTSDEYYLHIERPCSIAMSHSVPFFSFS